MQLFLVSAFFYIPICCLLARLLEAPVCPKSLHSRLFLLVQIVRSLVHKSDESDKTSTRLGFTHLHLGFNVRQMQMLPSYAERNYHTEPSLPVFPVPNIT